MTPTEFLNYYAPYAKETEKIYGVPYLVTLSQAALESGYGKHAPGFNFFGVKAGKAWTGPKQLLRTTEYLSSPDVKFPEIISITPAGAKYKYVVKDYFRKYNTPTESFNDHAKFLINNQRYKAAFNTTNALDFAKEVAKAGYATDEQYFNKLQKLITGINQVVTMAVDKVKQNPGAAGAGLFIALGAAFLLFSAGKKR